MNKIESLKKLEKILKEGKIDFLVQNFLKGEQQNFAKGEQQNFLKGEQQFLNYLKDQSNFKKLFLRKIKNFKKKTVFNLFNTNGIEESVNRDIRDDKDRDVSDVKYRDASDISDSDTSGISDRDTCHKSDSDTSHDSTSYKSTGNLLDHPFVKHVSIVAIPDTFYNNFTLFESVNLFYSILHFENILNLFKISQTQFLNFINTTFYFYNENIYHNIFHAFDTLFTGYFLYKKMRCGKRGAADSSADGDATDGPAVCTANGSASDANAVCTADGSASDAVCTAEGRLLALLLALFLHDVGHLGFTSKFMYETLFVDENLLSLNEKIHAFIAEKILTEQNSLSLNQKIVKLVKKLIMCTDLNKHKEYEDMIKNRGDCDAKFDMHAQSAFVDLVAIMKVSDISSTAKNTETSIKIGKLVLLELELERIIKEEISTMRECAIHDDKCIIHDDKCTLRDDKCITNSAECTSHGKQGENADDPKFNAVSDFFDKNCVIQSQINFYEAFSLPFFEVVAKVYAEFDFVYKNCKNNYLEFLKLKNVRNSCNAKNGT